MEQLTDAEPFIRREESLFKADIKDAKYHLRLRTSDKPYLYFMVAGGVYIQIYTNCGLSVAPWFFKKSMRPVVAYMRSKEHRVFPYLDFLEWQAQSAQITQQTRRIRNTQKETSESYKGASV